MTSEETLHVAIFPSLQVINVLDGGNMLVTDIEGSFSRNVYSKFVEPHSRFIATFLNKFYERAIISWRADKDKDGKPVTVKVILDDLAKDGVTDVALKRITFVIPYMTYDNYTMENRLKYVPWTFRPFTFRPLVWERLKASTFPCKELYRKWISEKRAFIKDKSKDEVQIKSKIKEIIKRWRDVILFNEPHPELDDADIFSMWQGRKFAVILKESRGKFDLMDLGEFKK